MYHSLPFLPKRDDEVLGPTPLRYESVLQSLVFLYSNESSGGCSRNLIPTKVFHSFHELKLAYGSYIIASPVHGKIISPNSNVRSKFKRV